MENEGYFIRVSLRAIAWQSRRKQCGFVRYEIAIILAQVCSDGLGC
jgi:hypothetical protein